MRVDRVRGKSLICTPIVLMLVIALAMTNVGFAAPNVYVDPATSVANPGDYFNVTIKVTGAPSTIGWQFLLRFDKDVLEFPPQVTEGTFLSNVGTTSGLHVVTNLIESYIHVGCHLGTGVASGSGDLAIVTFHVLESGVSNLTLLEATLYQSPDGAPAPGLTTTDGYFHSTKPFVDFFWSAWNGTGWVPNYPPEANENALFDASACWDPDGGSITQYSWDWGDGNNDTTSSPTITHKFPNYNNSGWLVTLTATDDEAETYNITKTLRMWHEVFMADMWPSIVNNADPWWWFDTVDYEMSWADQMWVLVTVVNTGTYTEEVTVTLYGDFNTTVIGDEEKCPWVWWDGLDFVPGSINTVPAGQGSGWNLPFLVDFIYLDTGNWTLTAVADPVPHEGNPNDNNLTYMITVTKPAGYVIGDINFDHKVNIQDIVSAIVGDGTWKKAYGSHPGDEVIYSEPAGWWVWHWKADIKRDKVIDIFDIVNIAIRYGQKW